MTKLYFIDVSKGTKLDVKTMKETVLTAEELAKATEKE
jgi:hypothetical protein